MLDITAIQSGERAGWFAGQPLRRHDRNAIGAMAWPSMAAPPDGLARRSHDWFGDFVRVGSSTALPVRSISQRAEPGQAKGSMKQHITPRTMKLFESSRTREGGSVFFPGGLEVRRITSPGTTKPTSGVPNRSGASSPLPSGRMSPSWCFASGWRDYAAPDTHKSTSS
jgi:hypothetical protein